MRLITNSNSSDIAADSSRRAEEEEEKIPPSAEGDCAWKPNRRGNIWKCIMIEFVQTL